MKKIISTLVLILGTLVSYSQTTHTINLPSSGTATIDVSCSVGDVLLFKSASTPLAIRVFRNPAPIYTVTPTGNSTSYTVTATDTSYSSIVSIFPSAATCVGKINLLPTSLREFEFNNGLGLVYPNPTMNEVYFEKQIDLSDLKIYNLSGQLMTNYSVNYLDRKINISDLPPSVYFINLNNRSARIVKSNQE